jgi:hypothetical protein
MGEHGLEQGYAKRILVFQSGAGIIDFGWQAKLKIASQKENPMKKSLFLLLCVVVLVPFLAFGSDSKASPGKGPAYLTPQAPNVSLSALLDFSRWFEAKHGLSGSSGSSCGANFCSQAQKNQCAQTCRRRPFVGLECCFDTCTSFCNCGSVPTGC